MKPVNRTRAYLIALGLMGSFLLVSCGSKAQSEAVSPDEVPQKISQLSERVQFDMPDTKTTARDWVITVQEGDQFGVRNMLGDWVIPPRKGQQMGKNWRGGLLPVRRDGKVGVLNYRNEVVLPFEYIWAPRILRQTNPWDSDSRFLMRMERPGSNSASKDRFRFFNQRGVSVKAEQQSGPFFGIRILKGDFSRYSDNRCSYEVLQCGKAVDQLEDVRFLAWLGEMKDNRVPLYVAKMGGGSTTGLGGPVSYGFLDENGKLVIPLRYGLGDRFKGDYRKPSEQFEIAFAGASALVNLDCKVVLIDQEGMVLRSFEEEGVPQRNSKGFMINEKGVYSPDGNLVFAGNPQSEIDTYNQYQGFVDDHLWFSATADQTIQIYTPDLTPVNIPDLKNRVYEYRIVPGPEYQEAATVVVTRVLKRDLLVKEGEELPNRVWLQGTRLYAIDGTPLTEWLPAGYDYRFHSWLYWKYHTDKSDSVTVYDFNNELVYSCNGCKVDVPRPEKPWLIHAHDANGPTMFWRGKPADFSLPYEWFPDMVNLGEQIREVEHPDPPCQRFKGTVDLEALIPEIHEALGLPFPDEDD